jgi:hypothetical protein
MFNMSRCIGPLLTFRTVPVLLCMKFSCAVLQYFCKYSWKPTVKTHSQTCHNLMSLNTKNLPLNVLNFLTIRHNFGTSVALQSHKFERRPCCYYQLHAIKFTKLEWPSTVIKFIPYLETYRQRKTDIDECKVAQKTFSE